ncbi:hypothetical protein Pcinc_019754 [Petrolisthes cinctipes]|uniref:Uncharacterized protein n=1 Tax=Petrolisthes cinctipes TaxID=88211 RepID=A0AAE1FKD8_PETCI|nr:hypothetical protein Pcinc_019754 [Petrolisthes cinctipes]
MLGHASYIQSESGGGGGGGDGGGSWAGQQQFHSPFYFFNFDNFFDNGGDARHFNQRKGNGFGNGGR